MNTNPTISSVVMRRVRMIHIVRPLFSTTTLAAVVLLLSVWGIGREVWIAHVIQNFSTIASSPERILAFLTGAFVNTRFIVQVLTIVAGGALVWVISEAVRTARPQTRLA